MPEFELRKTDDGVAFAFNVVCKPRFRREEIIEKLLSSLENLTFGDEYAGTPFAARVLDRTDYPEESKWTENILQVTNELQLKNIKKTMQ